KHLFDDMFRRDADGLIAEEATPLFTRSRPLSLALGRCFGGWSPIRYAYESVKYFFGIGGAGLDVYTNMKGWGGSKATFPWGQTGDAAWFFDPASWLLESLEERQRIEVGRRYFYSPYLRTLVTRAKLRQASTADFTTAERREYESMINRWAIFKEFDGNTEVA